jgi:ribosomal protein S18 acetylase RimI-like enzyme
MEIRDFRPSDIETLRRFKTESAKVSFQKDVDLGFFTRNLENSIKKDPSCVKVAEHEGKIAGYVWMEVKKAEDGPFGNIHHIYVDRPYRRAGLATMLLKVAENFLASKGVSAIKATITKSNQPSLRLFSVAGYSEERVVFEKRLAGKTAHMLL